MEKQPNKKENAARIQTSLLNGLERRVLVFFAKHQPKWVTSDMLTFVGFVGSLIIFSGFVLSNWNLNWLWLTVAGLIVNWYGDSMDGTLARVRKTQRPIYGFFIDHNMDSINEGLMFIGAGLSPLFDLSLAVLCYAAYMVLSSYVYINAHLKNEFKLTYAALGPTEFRVIVMALSLCYLYIEPLQGKLHTFTIFSQTLSFGIYDYVALGVWAILTLMFLISFVKDARYFAKIDPLKKDKGQKTEDEG